ncbi:MAG: hypothetical protein JOZ04_14790 [Acidimicrobiia bacterium]|nr:hypothetical protein [Acidimicrobiia bacterium]
MVALGLGAAALAGPLLQSAPIFGVGNQAIVINLPPKGELSTTGQGVRFRVTVTCTNMVPAPITVHLQQTRSQTVVNGSGTSGTSYRCTGRSERVPVIVLAPQGAHFNPGGATATATATCGASVCATATRNVVLFSPPSSQP